MVAINDEYQPGTREARRQATIAAIIDATTRLTESRGFDDIAILDICVEADVSISSFYLRFPSKEALLADIHSKYLADFRESLWERLSTVDFATPDHVAVVGDVVRKYMTLRVDYANRFRTMALAEQQHPRLADERRNADRTTCCIGSSSKRDANRSASASIATRSAWRRSSASRGCCCSASAMVRKRFA